MNRPKPLFPIRAEHGEGPVWDPLEQCLYWVDLIQGKYYKGYYLDGSVDIFEVGEPLGVLALREKGGLVMGLKSGFGFWDEQQKQLHMIAGMAEAAQPEVRFNDGAVDPRGRFFAGTMEWEGKTDQGVLYRLDSDHSYHQLEKGLLISNGMGWSLDQSTYYLIDTFRHVMFAYDFDPDTGNIANRSTHIQFSDQEFPDGMAMDVHGGFWVAMWGGGCVLHFDPKGKKIKSIPVPVSHPTSCCFGGPDMTTLFITSSQIALSDRQKWEMPDAGRTFAVGTDVKGLVEPRFKG